MRDRSPGSNEVARSSAAWAARESPNEPTWITQLPIGAADKLKGNYPDGDHNFPEGTRKVAYEWLDRWLKK